MCVGSSWSNYCNFKFYVHIILNLTVAYLTFYFPCRSLHGGQKIDYAYLLSS